MWKRIILYGITVLLTFYLALLYSSSTFLLLFYGEIIFAVILLIWAFPVGRKTAVSVDVPIAVAKQKDTIEIKVAVKQHFTLPGGGVGVQILVNNPQQNKKEFIVVKIPVSRKAGAYRGGVKLQYACNSVGRMELVCNKICCCDFLGLFQMPVYQKKDRKATSQFLVMPDLYPAELFVSRTVRDFSGESEEFSKTRAGNDPSEIFQIRDYKPGDRVSNIHWKLTAKTGDVMVRDHSLPLGCPVLLYVDNYVPKTFFNKQLHSEYHNGLMELVGSLSDGMVRNKCRHYVIWYDSSLGDIFRMRVENQEQMMEMIMELLAVPYYTEKLDLEQLYEQKYHETMYVTKIQITGDLTMIINEEPPVEFTEKTIEKQLRQMEIMV